MKPFAVLAAVAASLTLASAARAQSGDLAGQWVHEGTQQELVIRSSIQQRAYSMPGDFSLGGSMGAGSPTNTVISTTPTPTQVHREMALIVKEAGAFSWVTEKTWPESSRCSVTVRQEKLGEVSVQGSQATFAIREGFDRSSRSCNDRTSQSDRSGRTEIYQVRRSGSTLRISDGTTTWTFTPYNG